VVTHPPTCRVLPRSRVKLRVGRCSDVAGYTEQGTEGVERIEPPVEAECEFVEVGLQMLMTDPVMDAVSGSTRSGNALNDENDVMGIAHR
jgi:hypothetical protein